MAKTVRYISSGSFAEAQQQQELDCNLLLSKSQRIGY